MKFQLATAAIQALQAGINSTVERTPGFPVGPYKIECSYEAWSVEGITRFAEAALSLASLRNNQPRLNWVLLDADGYIIPSTEIKQGLAIMLTEAKAITEAVESYL
jgi:hypothetical protein